MTTRHAMCSCGQLRLVSDDDPISVSICHCLACQRRTGSPFGAQARFRGAAVKIEGRSQTFVRIGDGGSKVTFHFCPTCGSTVHYAIEGMDDMVAVPVGAFADPGFPAPMVSVYEDRRHGWVQVPDNVKHIS